MTLIVECPSTLSDSVRYRVNDGMTKVGRCLGIPIKPFLYYVPTTATHAEFVRAKPAGPERTRFDRWSWLDPFGGDIVSQDPSDIHELAHGCANSLSGWPPVIIREGFAECIAPTHDWRCWQRRRDIPRPTDLWSGPPGFFPGWYSAAAILTAVAYARLGQRGFVHLWNSADADMTFDALAGLCRMGAGALETLFCESCVEITRMGILGQVGGLLGKGASAGAIAWFPKDGYMREGGNYAYAISSGD